MDNIKNKDLPFEEDSKDNKDNIGKNGFKFNILPDKKKYPIKLKYIEDDVPCPIEFFKSGYSVARDLNKYLEQDKKVEDAIEFFDYKELIDSKVLEPKATLVYPEPEVAPDYDKEIYSDLNNLYKASYDTQKGVTFKASIQHLQMNRLKRVTSISDGLREDNYNFKKPKEFTLNERGHVRDIKAQDVNDRVVLHSFNDNVLTPKTIPYLIYDNGASIKGKGVDFTRRRFKEHLSWAHRHFNGHFYILFIDFSKFFDNLDHAKIIDYFSKILDPIELEFFKKCLAMFEVDISYMEEEEVQPFVNSVFNSLEYSEARRKAKRTNNKEDFNNLYNKSRMMKKSVDIGNHLSQMIGIYYPHQIDNYCKTVLGIHCYDRYMDDTAIMLPTKEDCFRVRDEIKLICDQIGLHMNMKKTRVIDPYKGPSTFLKINYKLTTTGQIIEKVHSDTIHRERRRILKYIELVNKGIMPPEDFFACYRSWRGSFWKYDSKTDIINMDKFLESNLTPGLKEYIMKHLTVYNIDKSYISQYLYQIKHKKKS